MGPTKRRMALSLARQVHYGKSRSVEARTARWNRKHSGIVGTPAGFLSDVAFDTRFELRHQHDRSTSNDFRSEAGARHNSKSRELSAAVRANSGLDRRRSATVSGS